MICMRRWLLACLLNSQVALSAPPPTAPPVETTNKKTQFVLAWVTSDDSGGVVEAITATTLPSAWMCAILAVVIVFAVAFLSAVCGYLYRGGSDDEQKQGDDDDSDTDEEDEDKRELKKMMARADSSTYSAYRYKTYLLFEDPSSSVGAMFVGYIIMGLVVASCLVILVGSLPQVNPDMNPENVQYFNIADLSMTVAFTIEYVCRFWASPIRLNFAMNILNLCDLATIVPVWVEVVYGANTINIQFLRSMRLMKIFRFFKVARINKDLQILALTIEKSSRYLTLLMWGLSIASFMMACAMFTFEGGTWDAKKGCSVRSDGECSPFESVPMSIYFAVTTMTTVGYGDNFPITTIGKIIAMMGQLVGVFVIAMPVTVLGADFMDTYTEVKTGRHLFKDKRFSKHNLYEHFGEVEDVLKTFLAELCSHISHKTTGISETVFLMSIKSVERDICAGLADVQEILTESDKEAHAQRKIQRANRIIEEAAKILREDPENEEDPG